MTRPFVEASKVLGNKCRPYPEISKSIEEKHFEDLQEENLNPERA